MAELTPEAARTFRSRYVDPVRHALAYVLGIVLAGEAVYVAGFGVFDELVLRGSAIGLALVIMLLARPAPADGARPTGSVRLCVDLVLIALAAYTLVVWILEMTLREEFFLDYSRSDFIVGGLGFVVILELTRRNFGLPMFAFCVLSFAYAFFGSGLPGIFEHSGFGFDETVETIWYSTDGVFGRPTAVVTQIVLVFIVFGVVLEGTGAGDVILKMAFAATGRLAGGPAHAAIMASGLFGTMSGSAIANVVSTGVFTIPVVRKRGFSPKFAGAVEAAASSGGQIVPPIMGVVAFLMADTTGIPYLTIVVAAIVPAGFYYASLFATVAIESRRLGLRPIPRAERAAMTRQDWVRSLIFVVPLALMVAILLTGRTAALAGFWATAAAFALGLLLNPEFRRSPRRILDTIARAGRTSAGIVVVVAAIGIIIGVVNMTGIGLRFSEVILALSGDNLFLAMVIVMIGCLVLGMGMPTGAAYLTIVLVIGPVLGELGVPILVAHLFVVYFAVLSAVTPPVALAAFAAAPISGSRPMETAVEAVRLSIAGFLIPFVFVFYPTLLIVENFDPVGFAWISARMVFSVWLIATALGGHETGGLSSWSRLLRLVMAVAALWTNPGVAVAAVAGGAALVAFDRRSAGSGAPRNAPVPSPRSRPSGGAQRKERSK